MLSFEAKQNVKTASVCLGKRCVDVKVQKLKEVQTINPKDSLNRWPERWSVATQAKATESLSWRERNAKDF